ncbi:MAG: phosphopantetheine-binding protein [Bryobacteraceae bacterium]
MGTRTQITEILRKVAKKPIGSDPDESLFDSGVIDSFALPDLVSGLETAFGISIPDSDLNPRKFDSISRIEAYLEGRR